MTSLQRIRVSDFRCIGELELELPSGGLVILAGPNGLGKSSVFEAIEWALTGDCARRRAFRPDARDNRTFFARQLANGAEASSYSVELEFSAGAETRSITRVGHGTNSRGSPERSIIEHLVRDGWQVDSADKLRTYLHLTHLLTQSRVVQPLFQDEQSQWTEAEGLFRLGRIEGAKNNLQRLLRASSRLNQRVSTLEREASDAKTTTAAWEALAANLERRLEILKQSEVRSESHVRELAQEVFSQLGLDAPASSVDLPLLGASLRRQLSNRRAELIGTRESLSGLVRSADRYASLELERSLRSQEVQSERVLVGRLEEQEQPVLTSALASEVSTAAAASREVDDFRRRETALMECVRVEKLLDSIQEDVRQFARATGRADSVRVGPSSAWTESAITELGASLRSMRLSEHLIAPAEVERAEARLADVEQRRKDHSSKQALAVQRLAGLRERASELRENAAQTVALISQLLSACEQATADCPVCGTNFPNDAEPRDFITLALSRLERADPRLSALDESVRAAESEVTQANDASVNLAQEWNEARADLDRIQALMAQADSIWALLETLPQVAAFVGARLGGGAPLPGVSLDAALQDCRASIARLEGAARDATQRVADAQNALSEHENKLREARVRLQSAEQAISGIDVSLSSIQASWTAAGLEGQPRPTTLREQLAKLDDDISALADDGLLAAKVLLVESSADRLDQERAQNRDREALLGEATRLGCAPESVVTVHRRRTVEADARLERAKDTLAQLGTLQPRLDAAATAYRKEVFEPLAPAMLAWLGVLLADRSWQAFDSASERGGKAGIELVYQLLDAEGHVVKNSRRPARQMLSEGQLAAVAVARLLTWNRAFPWSKWDALLLDDPIQYSDMIHVAGFADALRGLLESESRMQVIMSTHDIDLARFFRRKFETRGVDVRVVRFEAPSSDGVRWSML